MTAWPPFHRDEASEETIRVDPAGGADGGYYPPASYGYEPQPSGPPYPTASSGAPYGVPLQFGPPQQQVVSTPPRVRNSSVAPLFMVTVMVVVMVAGAVSVVYLLTGGRNSAAQPGPAPAAAAPSAASASSGIDACVVGEWLATSVRLTDPADDTSLTTDNGGFLRLRTDGTGELDFGSGVRLKGKLGGVTSEVMLIGKISFSVETANQTLTYRDAQVDARRVVFQSGRLVANERLDGDAPPEKYVCTGDAMRITSGGEETEYRRR
jgi:hypothetical protein